MGEVRPACDELLRKEGELGCVKVRAGTLASAHERLLGGASNPKFARSAAGSKESEPDLERPWGEHAGPIQLDDCAGSGGPRCKRSEIGAAMPNLTMLWGSSDNPIAARSRANAGGPSLNRLCTDNTKPR